MDYGIKIAQDGYDVETCSDDKLIMSSKFNTPKVIGTGTAKFTIGENNTESPYITISLGSSYVGTMPFGIGFVDFVGMKFRTNVSNSAFTDYLGCNITTSYNGNVPEIKIRITRTPDSSTFPNAYSTSMKMYLFI